MTAAPGQQTIIIKKQSRGRHGHHGGAWKVAYADFVTAMMAFFLVMWIIGLSPNIKKSIAQYFRDPGAFSDSGKGLLPGVEQGATGGRMVPNVQANDATKPSVDEAKKTLEQAAEHLRKTMAEKFSDLRDRIDIKVTDEGLLIELREAPDDGFFSKGSAAAKPETIRVLAAIAGEIGQLPNNVAIEGHTDSAPYASAFGSYGNWELSADRANTARRVLETKGFRAGQVEAVRGYADTRLRTPESPRDSGNRRISIVVRRIDAPSPKAEERPADGSAPAVAPAGAQAPDAKTVATKAPAAKPIEARTANAAR